MQSNSRLAAAAAVVAFMGAWAAPVQGQDAGHGYQQVVSANPFGLLLKLFNAEYERAVSESATIGIGGSYASDDDEDDFGVAQETNYINADVFGRFYPSGSPFEGWNFGVKVGVTAQQGWDESSTNLGYGFDANRSWLLGVNNNFYVGVGFGLKRVIGELPDGALRVIPTFRVVNIGLAF